MLYDIRVLAWSDELCDLFGVPASCLPEVRPSSGRLGVTADGIPVSGIAGDQQAALFGQACFAPGMTKNTYGTGSFVLMNVGSTCPPPVEGLLTTVAWTLGSGGASYALEGAIFVTGAAIQWLRDGLGIIETAAEVGPLAATIDSSEGVYLVPAFTGLGSPWWDAGARGAITGLSADVTAAHLVRATVESLAFEARAMLDAMRAGGLEHGELRVDGGAASMDLLCQLLADGTGARVRRPASLEATARGAAMGAAIGVGLRAVDEVGDGIEVPSAFAPRVPDASQAAYEAWLEAVRRVRVLAAAAPR